VKKLDKEILEIINREIGKQKLTITQISELLDFDRTLLTKFLNGNRIPNIEVLLKFLHYLFPETHAAYGILRRITPYHKSLQSFKIMLEIARLNRDEETVSEAAKILSNASLQKDKEWAECYLLWQEFRSGSLDKDSYLDSFLTITLQSDEMKAFRFIALAHFHYAYSDHKSLANEYIEKAKVIIDSLQPGLLKNSYLARYYGYKSQIGLSKSVKPDDTTLNYFNQSNKYAISELMVGVNYYNLGLMYQHHDHLLAILYIQKTLSILNIYSQYDSSLKFFIDYIEELIPRIRILANDFDGIEEEDLTSIKNKLIYNIKKENQAKARDLLNVITDEEKENDFILYCQGILESSIPILIKCLSRNIEVSQIYETPLPVRALLQLGIDHSIIDAMINAKYGDIKYYISS
jgi:transcriptional regulator with XRE-family HTH domain